MDASTSLLERFKAIYISKGDSWTVSVLEHYLKKEFEEIENDNIAGHIQQSLRIFVPMCGKSPDMCWLVGKGHTVVGVEWVEEAVKEFFEEMAIPHSVKQVNIRGSNVPLYSSEDQRISIYVADFFSFKDHLLGYFDFIWDNGTLTVFPHAQMSDYVQIIAGLLKKNGKMFLATFEYNQGEHPSMPFATTPDELDVYYSSEFFIKLIRSEGADTAAQTYRGILRSESHAHTMNFRKLSYFSWNFHLLIKK